MQGAHVGGERGLIADRRGDAAEQRRHFRAGLGEAEDIVHEEQHVLIFHIAEIFGDGEAGKCDAGTGAGRLVHLAEYEGDLGAFRRRVAVGVFGDDAGVEEFVVEIIAFAGALADTREHRRAAVALGNVVDKFLDEHGLADAGATEQADLAALGVGRDEIDDLDAGDQDGGFGGLINKFRGCGMDRGGLCRANGAALVDRFADDVQDAPQCGGADGDADLRAGVDDFLAAHAAIR